MNRLLACVFAAMLVLPISTVGPASAGDDNPSASRHQALKDPAAGVRLRAALALAKENDAEAIPVLIDLLAELPRERRRSVEEVLQQLAGEWAPLDHSVGEDEIGRRIRRDAWAAWWNDVQGEALLEALQKHTPPSDAAERIGKAIARLDDEDFTAREAAIKELLALGRIALPQLQKTAADGPRGTARQAKTLMERIEHDPAQHLPLAVLRLLAVRKPRGAAESVLAYLPVVEDDTHAAEAQTCLAALARREGDLEPALVQALKNTRPEVRATAAEALARGGGAAGCEAVRKLLREDTPAVRLRIALALGRAERREGVTALIDLLTVLPEDQAGQAEEALCQLAGETAPDATLGTDKAARTKCRDAWAAWWKVNAGRVDLTRLSAPLTLGYTLICDANSNRVYEIDRRGKQRWAIENVQYPLDARMVAGNHVLIAEYRGGRVTERDTKGNIVWQKQLGGNRPVSVQRLRNGNTLIGTMNGGVSEVDRTGKEVSALNRVPGGVMAAYRSRKGVTVCLTRTGQCILFDVAGKQIKSFAVEGGPGNIGRLDVRSDGRFLVAQGRRGSKVVEYDSDGKKQRELDAADAMTATMLANGNVLIASQASQRVYELNRAGKTVWEHKGGSPYRARRR